MNLKLVKLLASVTLAGSVLTVAQHLPSTVYAEETGSYSTVSWVTIEKDGTEKTLKETIKYDRTKHPELGAPGQFLGYKWKRTDNSGRNIKHIFVVDTTIKGDKDELIPAKPDSVKPFKDTYVGTSWLARKDDGTTEDLKPFISSTVVKKEEEVKPGDFKGYRYVTTTYEQNVRKHWFVKDANAKDDSQKKDSLTGWQHADGVDYLYQDGKKLTGLQKHDNKVYYLNNEGAKQVGWQYISGKWHYFNEDGIQQTGWLNLGSWYYMSEDGAMQTGWKLIGGKWYYLNSAGSMQTGWLNQGGKWYYLYSDGSMATGWAKVDGVWYYLNTSGAMITGWFQAGGKWYYTYSSGALAVSTTVDGYTVNANGEWI